MEIEENNNGIFYGYRGEIKLEKEGRKGICVSYSDLGECFGIYIEIVY